MNKKLLVFISIVLLFSLPGAIRAQKAQVLAVAKKTVAVLKNKDMRGLAALAHPTKGIRFSAFAYISRDEDLVFKPRQIVNLMRDKKVYVWGTMDESEEPIKMTFAEYYREFVYDYDFARADRINYNTKYNNGIMINNIAEAYPQGIEVEFFVDPTDDRMYGSLRLIFEKYRRKYYLVGIVRDTPGI